MATVKRYNFLIDGNIKMVNKPLDIILSHLVIDLWIILPTSWGIACRNLKVNEVYACESSDGMHITIERIK